MTSPQLHLVKAELLLSLHHVEQSTALCHLPLQSLEVVDAGQDVAAMTVAECSVWNATLQGRRCWEGKRVSWARRAEISSGMNPGAVLTWSCCCRTSCMFLFSVQRRGRTDEPGVSHRWGRNVFCGPTLPSVRIQFTLILQPVFTDILTAEEPPPRPRRSAQLLLQLNVQLSGVEGRRTAVRWCADRTCSEATNTDGPVSPALCRKLHKLRSI